MRIVRTDNFPRMTRRRSIAALLALLAFTAAFAEQVWASTCDGAMRMPDMAQSEAMAGMDHGQEHGSMPAPSPDHDHPDPECPLAAALALTGGCSITYQPATGLASPQLFPATASAALPGPDDVFDLLPATPPFHPPKA